MSFFNRFHNENRDCYDLNYSTLNLEFFLDEKKIAGYNDLNFIQNCAFDTLILDLSNHFIIDSVYLCDIKSQFTHKNNQICIPSNTILNESFNVKVFYSGHPKVAKNPPWKGGVVFEKDKKNMHWAGVACQNDGPSIWRPTKDDLSDEPDSVYMELIVNNPYFVVSNGRLDSVVKLDGDRRKFCWNVSNSINNYNVTFNIGNYVHFDDSILTSFGQLDLDYYVLPHNFELAKKHFIQVKPMLNFFEKKFGPYPFYEDGYKLVETPYLGMEHQSCISYGNKYKQGYLGAFPGDMDFDFIIIHETAHEWWGNSLSMSSRSDMWIHEAFATYSEALYVEEFYGYQDMLFYLNFQKKRIKNQQPLISNTHSTNDIYYKGTWLLHTLRTILDNDTIWNSILLKLQLDFKHKIINTSDVIGCIESLSEIDLNAFFQQYLYHEDLPILDYFIEELQEGTILHFKWNSSVKKFNMPILATINNSKFSWIHPTQNWQKQEIFVNPDHFKIAEDLLLLEVNRVSKSSK
ncbi:M1 family metallopeptidase [Flavobacteriales bacterium]|nr:M1 family metallopeptidase [Flavobacteriales bacterium]